VGTVSRYIDAEKFVEEMRERFCEDCDDELACWACGIHKAIEAIEDYPAADVAPVVHGKWVEPSYKRKKAGICGSTDAMAGKCRCSVCRHEEPVFEEYPKYNYCPYCGAKMDESEDTDNA
jgi:uncharacterized CHY-type Zn-finger protein